MSVRPTLAPPREDLLDAHDAAWARIGQPGTWLTARERVAIADESRRARVCELCSARTSALSPFADEGEHDTAFETPLSEAIVELVHRISTGSGRLSRSWYDGLELDPKVYVEALAVTATTVGIDTFHRATGLALRPLPAPGDGDPICSEAKGPLDHSMAWVPTRKLAGVPNVQRALSLVPHEGRGLTALVSVEYLSETYVLALSKDPGRAISRAQIELVASRLSVANQCFY